MSILLSNKLVVAGWVFFLLCLILPTTVENGGTAYGYQYGKYAIASIFDEYDGWPLIAVSGLSNILAALGLFVVVSRSPSFLLFFTLLFFMFGVNNGWYYIGGMKDLAVGYFMWVASFFLMSVGFLCSSLRQRSNSRMKADVP